MSVGLRLNTRITRLAVGRHLPYRTVRVRLTLLYGALFLISGAALMAITYALLVNAGFVFSLQSGQGSDLTAQTNHASPVFPSPGSGTHPSAATMTYWRNVATCMHRDGITTFPEPATTFPRVRSDLALVSDRDGAILAFPRNLDMQSRAFTQAAGTCGFTTADRNDLVQADRRRTDARDELLIQSGIALATMSLLSLALGWLVAGRVLGPLADAYGAQRQFVANASHELRAPLTRQRALIEVALDDPDASVSSLRAVHERVLASEQQLEQLIDGLLTLTRGQAGLERRDEVELAGVVTEALRAREPELADLDLDVHADLSAAVAVGDPRLLERLVANLLDNAIRHNVAGGHVEIRTALRDRRALLSVANGGPAVPPDRIDGLFRPFERLEARTHRGSGHGLGLSIVQAIAGAHGAEVEARARPEGGLAIEVRFPAAVGVGSGLRLATGRVAQSFRTS
jgi:signal transduction histidine kinase